MSKMLTTSRKIIPRGFALIAFASLMVLLQAGATRAQWATNGNNINNTNPGNVGIGTAAPEGALHVHGTTEVLSTGTRAGFKFRNRGSSSPNDDWIWYSEGNVARFWRSNVGDLMGITPTGNVGIGTTSPQHKLDVSGNMTIGSGYTSSVTVPANGLIVQGAVGIGTNNPGFQLDVVSSTDKPFRVGNNRWDYISTGSRTGPNPQWTTPVVSLAGDRLIVENDGPEGGNGTVIRHLVNAINIKPSEHPDYPGAFVVEKQGGGYPLVVEQNTVGNVGIGTKQGVVNIVTKLNVDGDINVSGNINAKYQDVAEWVPSSQKLMAGTVVVLDVEHNNHVTASSSAYDTRVAGVVSAQPGIALGEAGEGKALVATTGRVKVKVDATKGAIRVGDLLVTSDVAGVAMLSQPVELGGVKLHRPGTIIGKALEPLEKGTGEILVLLSLQ